MGKDRNRERLERIEGSLTPKEMVASLIEEFAKFDSIDNYAAWVAEDPSRLPLHRMHQQLKSGVSRHQDGRGKNSSRALPRNRSSEVLFLYYLLLRANEHVLDFLRWEEFRVPAINERMQGVSERVYSGMAALGLWKGLADTPYPLEADIVAAVSAALGNDITSFAALAFEITNRKSNDLAGQAANEEASSESTCKRLERALHDLCVRGLVKHGSSVTLGLSPIGFLVDAPLVDGVWIDQVAIELAESAALLRERGVDLELSAPHPLAPLRPCRRNEIPGVQKADVVSEDEITFARKEAVARLSTFTGRTKKIDGRPYFHLDDYQAWSERKAGDDLEVTEGVVTASWNAWVETSGNNPQLAGISVSKLDPGLKEEDYFVCKNPERRRRREEMASLTRTLMLDSNEISKIVGSLEASRVDICGLLKEVGATVIAMQRLTARYFTGRKILFKSYAATLSDLNASVTRLVDDYNRLVDYIEASQNRIIFDTLTGKIEKIDASATDQSAEEKATILVSKLIASARAEVLSAETEWVVASLKPFVTGEADQVREPHA